MRRQLIAIAALLLVGCAHQAPPAPAVPLLHLSPASLAAAGIAREFAGDKVDWQAEYGAPLKAGVDAFRAFVESWYAGGFQDVIFHADQSPEIRRMICSILAGYAWDLENPYVEKPERLKTLEQICAAS